MHPRRSTRSNLLYLGRSVFRLRFEADPSKLENEETTPRRTLAGILFYGHGFTLTLTGKDCKGREGEQGECRSKRRTVDFKFVNRKCPS
ncbi:hypothetical protein SISSUDRAFT_294312 [Sistotremastrum suecicum HHB10207 ss-3]|uniref:Uncharacterized protein n=1 Tax=Sistotremastrum suecicum HHB10207 ss-3 TaxID=1314776 RepID=A0A165ZID6_9AGAM|nr:hypothetical protein SISSUDRAFT_294312 [Sistotremastrum suecicum HHB10207 ss-3]